YLGSSLAQDREMDLDQPRHLPNAELIASVLFELGIASSTPPSTNNFTWTSYRFSGRSKTRCPGFRATAQARQPWRAAPALPRSLKSGCPPALRPYIGMRTFRTEPGSRIRNGRQGERESRRGSAYRSHFLPQPLNLDWPVAPT